MPSIQAWGGNAMLKIEWRLPAAYGHTRHIPAAGFAWEYLRRNHDYRRDFQTIAQTGGPTGRDLEGFADRWGLRFPVRSRRAT
ncbi:transcriptional regulator domain-containing protein [Brucella anthropi]|uniref:transcriptional regulator domain-containing protein n=1 Tax=Brucella anthropi TaxID=529 RepID=UPI003F73EBA5